MLGRSMTTVVPFSESAQEMQDPSCARRVVVDQLLYLSAKLRENILDEVHLSGIVGKTCLHVRECGKALAVII